jgi:pimeloyl-[acyl-carrier protein] methyl ester esterase
VTSAGGWVLVPGWGADAEAFAGVCARLPGIPVRVVGWDEALVRGPAAVAAASDALGPGPVRLAGWSLGALLALEAALALPGRHAALALVSATARFCGDGEGHPGTAPRALRAMRLRLARDRAGVLGEFAARSAAPDGAAAERDAWRVQADRFTAETLARGLEALAALDLRDRLAALRAPVRMLHGACDGIVPAAAASTTATAFPDARLTILPGRGHALPLSAPGEVAALLAGLST